MSQGVVISEIQEPLRTALGGNWMVEIINEGVWPPNELVGTHATREGALELAHAAAALLKLRIFEFLTDGTYAQIPVDQKMLKEARILDANLKRKK